MTSSYYTLLVISMILYHCHAFLQPTSSLSSSSYNYCSTLSVRCDTIINSSVTGADDDVSDGVDEEEQQHLHGIGVGIDLGTTNSAVAMMMIDEASSSG